MEHPVYVGIESAISVSYDDQGQMLVTTREGNATIFTEATGGDGFAVPAGKTAVIPSSLKPALNDTDSKTAREADDLLSDLKDPFAASPVFAGTGVAAPGESSGSNGTASGASSGTNGTAPGSGATGVPGAGNATTGNATNTGALGGISSPGGPSAPGASGTGTSTGGTASPSGNNQIGEAANISAGQSISQIISPAGSSNFYRFKVDSSGIVKLKLENVPKDMRPYLSLYDKNMATISEKSASNPGDVLTLEKDIKGPGWFYIEARDIDGKAHSEPYSLKVAFEPAPDQYDPNPNYFRAAEVKSGQTINAYICPSGDDDFYKIFVNTSGIFKLKMDSVPADMRPYLELRDKGFNSIAYSSASSPGDKVKLEKDVQGPGWFYIRVNDADGKAHNSSRAARSSEVIVKPWGRGSRQYPQAICLPQARVRRNVSGGRN